MSASTTKVGRPLADMTAYAAAAVQLLNPACEAITIAGSIRRRKPAPADIELVAIPRVQRLQTDLFGATFAETDVLDELCEELLRAGTLEQRRNKLGRPSWGRQMKLALYHGIPLDLFTATPETLAVTLVIRTGPADFCHWLATSTYDGGAMPFGCRLQGWRIWQGNRALDTPTEESVFQALNLEYVEPVRRKAPAGWERRTA